MNKILLKLFTIKLIDTVVTSISIDCAFVAGVPKQALIGNGLWLIE